MKKKLYISVNQLKDWFTTNNFLFTTTLNFF